MLRRNGPVIKSMQSVLRPEESVVGKIVEEVTFEPAVEVDHWALIGRSSPPACSNANPNHKTNPNPNPNPTACPN